MAQSIICSIAANDNAFIVPLNCRLREKRLKDSRQVLSVNNARCKIEERGRDQDARSPRVPLISWRGQCILKPRKLGDFAFQPHLFGVRVHDP
jgi:hypothetical protein